MNGEHLVFDRNYGTLVAGVDEAGCSPLSGPVVAGAVIFRCTPPQSLIQSIDDSKTIPERKRNILSQNIKRCAIWAVGSASPKEIEEINIYHASVLAMERAVENLSIRPNVVLADGNRKCTFDGIENYSIVKGDEKSLSIAAGSIVAKVHRDSMMRKLGEIYPEYNWKSNKGYPCKAHKKAIEDYGVTAFHRRNWKAVRSRMMETFRLGRFEITHKRAGKSGASCDSCNKRLIEGASLIIYGHSTKTGICIDCLERAISWQEELMTALLGDLE